MVSADEPPVVKLVEETVAVQSAPKPRASVTWTWPRVPGDCPPGAAADRMALAGAGMGRGPAMMPPVSLEPLPGVPVGGQVLPAAVEVTVLTSVSLPVSGLLTVT